MASTCPNVLKLVIMYVIYYEGKKHFGVKMTHNNWAKEDVLLLTLSIMDYNNTIILVRNNTCAYTRSRSKFAISQVMNNTFILLFIYY